MSIPADPTPRLRIDGREVSDVRQVLIDLGGSPVRVTTGRGVLVGVLTVIDEATVMLEVCEQERLAGEEGLVSETGYVRVADIVAVDVIRPR